MESSLFLFSVFLQLVACASESASEPASESGLARSRLVASLSSDEASSLCDWSITTQGGAGKTTKCDETSSRVVHTKDECLEDIATITKLASCYALTVGEVEDCSKEEAANACGPSSACDALNGRLEECAGKDRRYERRSASFRMAATVPPNIGASSGAIGRSPHTMSSA